MYQRSLRFEFLYIHLFVLYYKKKKTAASLILQMKSLFVMENFNIRLVSLFLMQCFVNLYLNTSFYFAAGVDHAESWIYALYVIYLIIRFL